MIASEILGSPDTINMTTSSTITAVHIPMSFMLVRLPVLVYERRRSACWALAAYLRTVVEFHPIDVDDP